MLLTLSYLCNPPERHATAQEIWEAALEAFRKCNEIVFGYSTQRFYNYVTEGKVEASRDRRYISTASLGLPRRS